MEKKLIEPVISLVKQAGQAILPFWRGELTVDTKQDDSPVTAADLAANAVLLAGLKQLTPDIPVLSEEACQFTIEERQTWRTWWLVDPLDGTKGFIKGKEEFTVNVALIEQGRVVFGVVGCPVSGDVYYGGANLGAFKRIEQNTTTIQVRDAQSTFVVVASPSHTSPEQDAMIAGLTEAYPNLEVRKLGSSLKFCLLAEGKIDFYPRFAPTSQWDTAAAQAVLEGAGGQLLTVEGNVFDYPVRADLINPYFLALPKKASWRTHVLSNLRK